MKLIIQVSFKNNEKEVDLYAWVLKHSSYSNFIKDILMEAKENERKEKSNN
ncbi:MAG: hypothetical protein E7I48_17420 [Clostridium celatum]|nr:hypothetical protein [Clostridium celatum]